MLRVQLCGRGEARGSTWIRRAAHRAATDDTRRLRRWLYQGLHSLDFPVLYYKRPLWDIVVIVLSIGGLALSATTLVPAWRRLRRHASGAVGGLRATFARAPHSTLSHHAPSTRVG